MKDLTARAHRRFVLLIGAASLGVVVLGCQTLPGTGSGARDSGVTPTIRANTTRGGESGPPFAYPEIVNQWVANSPDCATGVGWQSPIDLSTVSPITNVSMQLTIPKPIVVPVAVSAGSGAFAANQNFIFTVPTASPTASAPSLQVNSTVFTILQYHFHTPAEHRLVSGPLGRPTMEAHVVTSYPIQPPNAPPTTRFAVFGVLLQEDPTNGTDVVTPIINYLNAPGGQNFILYDSDRKANSLLAPFLTQALWHYEGSLTTPGCNGGVIWHVSTKPLLIKPGQAAAFGAALAASGAASQNARGTQPLNGRVVQQWQN